MNSGLWMFGRMLLLYKNTKIKESSAFKQGSLYIRRVNPEHLQELP